MNRIQNYTLDTGGAPNTLQEAQVLALSQADCEDVYSGTPYDIYDDMICVGHDNDVYTGACYVSLKLSTFHYFYSSESRLSTNI